MHKQMIIAIIQTIVYVGVAIVGMMIVKASLLHLFSIFGM